MNDVKQEVESAGKPSSTQNQYGKIPQWSQYSQQTPKTDTAQTLDSIGSGVKPLFEEGAKVATSIVDLYKQEKIGINNLKVEELKGKQQDKNNTAETERLKINIEHEKEQNKAERELKSKIAKDKNKRAKEWNSIYRDQVEDQRNATLGVLMLMGKQIEQNERALQSHERVSMATIAASVEIKQAIPGATPYKPTGMESIGQLLTSSTVCTLANPSKPALKSSYVAEITDSPSESEQLTVKK